MYYIKSHRGQTPMLLMHFFISGVKMSIAFLCGNIDESIFGHSDIINPLW
jgi:hypothetical protein